MKPRRKITPTQRAMVFRDAGGVCHLCKLKIVGSDWHVEHPKMLEMDGSDDLASLRPAHIACHAVKTSAEIRDLRKADRMMKAEAGIKSRRGPPMPGTKRSGLRKRMSGQVEKRP